MRRFVAFTIASCFVLATGPAAALARPHHHRHHHHARTERFGTLSTSTTTTSPTTPPAAAGTITSFTNGVLTITLSDNSTVSGAVTPNTEIECQSSSATMGGDLATDGNPSDGSQGGGDSGQGSGTSDQGDGGDQGDDDGGQSQSSCGTAALTPGATVLGAELEITSSGAVWTKIELG